MALTQVDVACLGDKISLDTFMQVAVITLEGTPVLVFGVNNQLTVFLGC